MPYIILKERGFEKFNGLFGTIEFKDGRSVEPVSAMEAQRFGAITRCETEDGVNPSPTQRMLDERDTKASTARDTRQMTEEESQVSKSKSAPAPKAQYDFTRESLESEADKNGIKGLRAIAAQYGVKGKAVGEIIDEMMALKEAK